MKNNLLNRIEKILRHKTIFVSLLASALILNANAAFSQEKKESASAGQAGKLSPRMTVSCKVSDGIKTVKVQVNRKENKKTISVTNLTSPVKLYLNKVKDFNSADGTGLISKVSLNNEGEAIFTLTADFNKLTSALHEFTFIAKIDSDPLYEDAQGEVTVSEAKIIISYSGKDSIKTASAVLSAWKDSAYVPVPNAEMKLYIKRVFSLFPIGEEGASTDKDGAISADLPLDIPGTVNGTIIIAAKIADNESYGTVEATKEVPWAVLPKVMPERGRTLWSDAQNAPLILVFSSVTIIVVIWGTIFYLVSLLIKIRKISKE